MPRGAPVSDPERRARAREQTLGWLNDAVRRGDYLEAVQWLDTLAAVDERFTLTADALVARWRERAGRFRRGDRPHPAHIEEAEVPDYRGLFGTLLRSAYDSIVISNVADGWMLECSNSFLALTGYGREELLGRTSVELGLIEPHVREAAVATTQEQQAAGGFETRLIRKDGEQRWVEFSPQVLAGRELLLTILRDVTERKQLEEHTLMLADRDALTGVHNRVRLEDEVARRIAEAARFGDRSTMLVIDVDRMQALDDAHGDGTTERALCAVADALMTAVRDTDLVARLHDRTFAMVLSRTDTAGAEPVVRDVGRLLEQVSVTTSSGSIAIEPRIGLVPIEASSDAEAVLARAIATAR